MGSRLCVRAWGTWHQCDNPASQRHLDGHMNPQEAFATSCAYEFVLPRPTRNALPWKSPQADLLIPALRQVRSPDHRTRSEQTIENSAVEPYFQLQRTSSGKSGAKTTPL